MIVRVCGLCWLSLILTIASSGCGSSSTSAAKLAERLGQLRADESRTNDGRLILGAPSLTSGIPGEGALKLDELTAWLADPEQHEPLRVALPPHLAAAQRDVNIPADNPLTRAKIELGRQLYFDQRLSKIGSLACGECHHPKLSYTSFIKGNGLRDPLPTINRILSKRQFWDGKAASLEEQVKFPVTNEREQNLSPEELVAKLNSVSGYKLQFERIFGEVSFTAFSQAIASFERALVTGPSAWDRSQSGEENAMSPLAKQGEAIFFGAKAQCDRCHRGPNFTDEEFHPVGTGIDERTPDLGRFSITGRETDRGAFKTPTLRNVAVTHPYLHDARFDSLAEVVAWFNAGGHLPPGPGAELVPLGLSPGEQQALVEFLKSLTSALPPVETRRLPE